MKQRASCDRKLTKSFPSRRNWLHPQCNSGVTLQPSHHAGRGRLPGEKDGARHSRRAGSETHDSSTTGVPAGANHSLAPDTAGTFQPDPQRSPAIGSRQHGHTAPAQGTPPAAPRPHCPRTGKHECGRQGGAQPLKARRAGGDRIGQRQRKQAERRNFCGAKHEQGPPQRMDPVLAQPAQGPPQPRIRRGGRQACRWCRRNRSCSSPPHRSSCHAPCWPRSPGRTRDPGCRC